MLRINLACHIFDPRQGYPRFALYLMRELLRLGVKVTPVLTEMFDTPGWVRHAAGIDASAINLWVTQPKFMHAVPGFNILYTMFEDQCGTPDDWVDDINQYVSLLIVPCEQNRDLFKAMGVKCPIVVVHGGTSPEDFPITLRKPDDTFVFGCLGDRMPRKGTEVVLSAFYDTFPRETHSNVRLEVKTLSGGMMNGQAHLRFADPRVHQWAEDSDSLRDFFEAIDCFVFPSFGEGWGMPCREAAMMGIPTIVSRNTGMAVGIDDWATYVVEQYHLQDSLLNVEGGKWCVPSWQEVGVYMKAVYVDYQSAKEKALLGADWLRREQTWEHSARSLLNLIQEYAF